MDDTALRRSRSDETADPVAILAGAASVGSDYDQASARARAHYEQLGATVVVLPDPRADLDASLAALDAPIGMLVLPGGSPESLADMLLGSTPEVGERIIDLHDQGMAISGASAGAMVLGEYCILPKQSKRRSTTVTHGLAVVEGVVLPHWTPNSNRWPLPDEVHLWGLPECGGVLIDGDGTLEAVGEGAPSFRFAGADWLPVMRSISLEPAAAVVGG